MLSWSMARLILAVIALFLTCLCCGDGFYAAKEGEGVPKAVFERAIVSLHNGVETVIVQSQIDAPAGSYAWIVPVPTPPTKVFEGNNLVVDQTFRHFSPGHLYYATVLAGIIWVLGMALIGICAVFRIKFSAWGWALVSFLWAVTGAVLFPVYAIDGSARSVQVDRNTLTEVSQFEETTISSKNSGALSQWFRENEFVMPQALKPQVEGYVKQGWSFVAVKMGPFKGGKGFPLALGLRFPAKKLVYPMRFALAGEGTTLLDLLVISDGTASAPPLNVWRTMSTNSKHLIPEISDPLYETPLEALSWPTSVATRLRGQIEPSKTPADLQILSHQYSAYRLPIGSTKRSNDQKRIAGYEWGLAGIWLVGLVLGFTKIPVNRALALCGLAAVLIGGGAFYCAETGVTEVEPGLSGLNPHP